MRRHRLALPLLLALVVAGCSGDDSAGGDGPVATGSTSGADPAATAGPWEGGPDDLCLLLRRDEVGYVLGFAVEPEDPRAKDADGTPVRACLWTHDQAGTLGGFVLVEALPADRLAERRQALTEAEEQSGLGTAATVGHAGAGYGTGPNAVVVDMGDGGFHLFASVYQTLTVDEVVGLAERAELRWNQDAAGGIAVDPDPSTTVGVPGA